MFVFKNSTKKLKIMKYKVIKEFGSAKKGDILNDVDTQVGMISFYIEEDNSVRSMSLDYDTADMLCEEGYLEEISEHTAEDANTKALELIDTLLEQYRKDNDDMQKKVLNKEIQPCVGLESTTVYANLTKVLNKIKGILEDTSNE